MASFPNMYGDNQRLFDEAIASGLTHYVGDEYEYFKNADNSYNGFPIGFIRGPHYVDNGSMQPYTMSVYGADGWHQRSCNWADLEKTKQWAIELQASILQSQRVKPRQNYESR